MGAGVVGGAGHCYSKKRYGHGHNGGVGGRNSSLLVGSQ